jgi:hypothetical protein
MNAEDEVDRSRAALESVLHGHFAAQQLEAQATLYLYGATFPTVVLWVNAWYPLADLVRWFAALGWSMCAVMTISLAVLAAQRRTALFATLPEATRLSRLHFAPNRAGRLRASGLLMALAALTSVGLWLHALVPRLLGAPLLQTSYKTWIVFFVGAIGCRILELA